MLNEAVAEMMDALKAMTILMAVTDPDVIESQTIVFGNAAHGGLSVVYRRPDGNIGWIDPERTKVVNGGGSRGGRRSRRRRRCVPDRVLSVRG